MHKIHGHAFFLSDEANIHHLKRDSNSHLIKTTLMLPLIIHWNMSSLTGKTREKLKKHIGQKCFRNSTKMKRGNLLPLKNQTGQKLVWTRVMYVIKNVRNKALTTSKFFEIIFPSWGLIPRWRIEINRLPNDSSNTLPTHNTAPQSY